MIEAQERPQPQVREIRYPGFVFSIREITSTPGDVDSIRSIEKALASTEYAETGSGTPQDTLNWLHGGVTRKFDSLNPGSKRKGAVGTEEGIVNAAESMIIAVSPIGKVGELAGYTYIYNSEDYDKLPQDLQEKYAASKKIDLSYVTATPDEKRSPDEIAESLMQTAMLLWEKVATKTIDQLTGQLTPEQMEKAQKELSIFADSGVGDNETNYREGLKRAGFEEVHHYIEYDEDIEGNADFITHRLSLEGLAKAFEQKRSQKLQTK
ncbi:hypothetical protein A3D77_06840 [Candidatus Gottesmanbacteria bacterium RIFCSPHIGHO2_02_FULL_39_11]|uniref:Uncharacterized protein n=1 Tax=Candidatus Gottesmanbacteria bacterium RIFCSPHIGHO2_02_FULL_39_11 TaxID=1798382 RepID=A0A1F5ZK96_9BACT|nr:MAG: hypothetical protein A3D77_06840 [Candidatus Gottesmanbacteria bacterium RIFCSPHIGHO2_02_FULL_39_11]